MSGYYKRVVIKELEVGTGEIPGTATGNAWPFEPTTLYHEVQGYSPDRSVYDSVVFDSSVSWRIEAEFTRDGQYQLTVPQLGVDVH
jgi:hypothetical protein